MVSPRLPVDMQQARASTATIHTLDSQDSFLGSSNLRVTRLTISLFKMEEMPRASPAPVPTTAMNSVPRMTPARMPLLAAGTLTRK